MSHLHKPFGSIPPSWVELGRLHDRIEVLECREVQYQKLILLGITLITVKNNILEGQRIRLAVREQEGVDN